jgi:hypothetical protein
VTRSRQNGDRGTAMTSTMVFLVIATLALMGSLGDLKQLSRLEESALRVPSSSDGTAEAMGISIARMHTGVPPDSPYTCRTRLRSSDGKHVLKFSVTHTRLADDRWSLAVAPSNVNETECPSSFAEACPLGVP